MKENTKKMKLYTLLKIVLIWLILFLNGYSFLYAQQINEIKPTLNIPTSPEAAKLGKYGDINIDLYSGQPQINIPLFTIQENGIEIPISLTYNNSGIKVSDEATWVGLGWNLSGESMIIQSIQGSIDEMDMDVSNVEDYMVFRQRVGGIMGDYGFLFQMGRESYIYQNNCIVFYEQGWPYYDFIGDKLGALDIINRKQGVPDIFRYNAGNRSGSYFINPETKEIVFINPKEKVFIEKNNENTNFVITTLDGTRYSFNSIEKVYPTEAFEFSGKTLKLTDISFLNGDTVSFYYDDHTYWTYEYYENALINYFAPPDGVQRHNQNHLQIRHDVKTLKRIVSNQVEVVFNQESREDLINSNKPRLKSIDIFSRLTQKKVKTIEFEYSYFPYNTIGSNIENDFIAGHINELGKRLKLDIVKEIGYNDGVPDNSTTKMHRFEYDLGYTLPLKCSFAKDFWGYYNGQDNNKLLPDLEYFDFLNAEDLGIINQNLHYPYAGANRFTDNLKAGTYLLKKIYYPTGGFSELEYEPNSFSNQFVPDQSDDIHKSYYLTEEPANYSNTSVSFHIDKRTTIHFRNEISNFSYGKPKLTTDEMAGSKIVFYKMKWISGTAQVQSIIEQWDLSVVTNQEFMENNGVVFSQDIPIIYDPDPDVFYTVTVDFPQVLDYPTHYGIGVHSRFDYFDDTGVDITESTQCGMRIKSIKNYKTLTELANHKDYQYFGGKLKNNFNPIFYYFANVCNFKEVSGGVSYEYADFYKKITLDDKMFDLLATDAIGYDKVVEIELSNGQSTNGNKEYHYINEMNTIYHDCPIIPFIGNGLLTKEMYYDNNNINVKEVVYNYDFSSAPDYKCIKSVTLATGILQLCGNEYNPNPPVTIPYYAGSTLYASIYGFDIYNIANRKITLHKITDRQFFNSGNIENVTDYQYNDLGQVSNKSENSSDGNLNITKFYYPTDKMVDPIIEEKLIQVHNIGRPSMIEEYKGELLVKTEKIKYFDEFTETNVVLPKFFYQKNGQSMEECRTIVQKYNQKCQIIDLENDYINKSLIYGLRDRSPIAIINNAISTECGYTGFENHETNIWQTGNWSYNDDANASKTGNSSALVIGPFGPQALFNVGENAGNHNGYKASVWVMGSTSASLKITPSVGNSIEVTNSGSSSTEWKLLEVEIPKEMYKNSISPSFKITVIAGCTSGSAYFDDLRFQPMDAEMTTYTYKPLIGMTTESDAGNIPIMYEYDSFGRLFLIRDHLGNILKRFEYNYAH